MGKEIMNPQGIYILLEGGEGCGKSTQAKILVDNLISEGRDCIYLHEPGITIEGNFIAEILRNPKNSLDSVTELFLFEAARRDAFRKVVAPALEEGKIIIADRSGISTLVYQGYAGDADLELTERLKLIRNLNSIATLGITPDLTLILDVPVEIGLARETDPSRFAAKGKEYHEKVNDAYRTIARQEGFPLLPYIENGIEETQLRIRTHVDPILAARSK